MPTVIFSHTLSPFPFHKPIQVFFFPKEFLVENTNCGVNILCGLCVVAYQMNYVILTCHHPFSMEY